MKQLDSSYLKHLNPQVDILSQILQPLFPRIIQLSATFVPLTSPTIPRCDINALTIMSQYASHQKSRTKDNEKWEIQILTWAEFFQGPDNYDAPISISSMRPKTN